MSRIIEEGGKAYLIEEGRVVAASTNKEALMPEKTASFKIGDRVEYDGKLGRIVAHVPTIYGDNLSIKLDSGAFISSFPEDLKYSAEEVPSYADALDEFAAEYDEYNSMPTDTLDEVRSKAKLARSLNLRAKALITDSQLSFTKKTNLDVIVTSTGVDIYDLKIQEEALAYNKEAKYLSSQPKYALSEEVYNGGRWTTDDASWLDETVAEIEEDELNYDWDAILAEEAVVLSSRITSEDSEIIEANIAQHFARTINREEKLDQFRSNVLDLLSQRAPKVEKTASTFNPDDVSDEAMFL